MVKRTYLLMAVVVLAVAALAGGFYYFKNKPTGQVACTMEAKLCSDGSYVGRQGPKCEFKKCPENGSAEQVIFENQYMKIEIPSGWQYSAAKSGAVNIAKDNYILFINPNFQQASGVTGGRFAEISQGSPSADAVVIYQPSSPCGSPQTNQLSGALKRVDLFVSPQDKTDWCAAPSSGSVWYFSYITGADGYYVNYYKPNEAPGYVITMSYNSKDANKLPAKGGASLGANLAEMSGMLKTLELKQAK